MSKKDLIFEIDMLQAVTMSRQYLNNNLWRILFNEYTKEVGKFIPPKLTKQNVLDDSTFRKNYLEDCHNLAIFCIQEKWTFGFLLIRMTFIVVLQLQLLESFEKLRK